MPESVTNTQKIDPRTLKVPTRINAQEESRTTQTEIGKPSLEPELAAERTDGPRKPAKSSPFRRYSLLGKADEIEASAAEAKPLLGKFVLRGQATMIYAEPNTGKTLITLKLCLDAIERGKIDPDHLYYINADDSSHGLAGKAKLLEEAGAHMLAPGWRGFRTGQLVELLVQAVEERSARGTCIIIDTLKKFTDLMDKKRSSEFAQICRQYVMAGGTILALGHTTKRPNADGTPQYQGTTDILEDFDAVYVAQPMTPKAGGESRVVKFSRKKARADSPETVAYAYSVEPGISYDAKLASALPIPADELADYEPEHEEVSDPLVMDAIVQLIQGGFTNGKMALAKAAGEKCGISKRAAVEVLERYTGDTPNEHLWNYVKAGHNKSIYRLIDQTKLEP